MLFLTFCNIFSKSKKQKEHFFNFLTQPGKLRTMNYRRKREGGILSLCWCWKFYISHLIKKKKKQSIRCPCSRHLHTKTKQVPQSSSTFAPCQFLRKNLRGDFTLDFSFQLLKKLLLSETCRKSQKTPTPFIGCRPCWNIIMHRNTLTKKQKQTTISSCKVRKSKFTEKTLL